MRKRVSYYVSRKHVLTWLTALILVASAVLRIADFCGKGTGTTTVWLQLVLPVAGCLIFVLIILLNGQERFYRTAVPVFMFAIFYGLKVSMAGIDLRLSFVFWIAFLALASFYLIVVSGYLQNNWGLFVALAVTLGVFSYSNRQRILTGGWQTLMPIVPDLLILLAGVLIVLAMQVHLDGAYHPTWGDRSDGRRLHSIDPMQTVSNYLMWTRTGSSNVVHDSIEITNIERYIREKRKEGLTNFGITHVFLASYVRCVAKYPAVNRFVSGQKVYTRDDDIQFCMVVKTEMATDATESVVNLHLKPTDTAYEVYEKLNAAVDAIKGQPLESDFDKTAKLLSMIPGLVLKLVVWVLRVMDYFGMLPKFLLEVSPFHGSIFFTSMGSLGIPPIVHHLYDFGNLPVFIAFGCKRRANEILDDGTIARRKYVDFSVNTDERICDGFYFATVLKYMKKVMQHPERLDNPPEEVIRDVD